MDDLPEDLKPGVSARAEIVITSLSDVIRVPNQSVTSVKGQPVCYVKDGREFKPVPVEIGLFNTKFIEIKSGLNEGDLVLLAPPFDVSADLGGAVVEDGEEDLDLSTGNLEPAPTAAPRGGQGGFEGGRGDFGGGQGGRGGFDGGQGGRGGFSPGGQGGRGQGN